MPHRKAQNLYQYNYPIKKIHIHISKEVIVDQTSSSN